MNVRVGSQTRTTAANICISVYIYIYVYAHGVIVLIVPSAHDRALVRPEYFVGHGHGQRHALQSDRVGRRPVLSPGTVDDRRALHQHRRFGVHLAEPRAGRFAVVFAGGRGRHVHR